ncbi:potassium transporter [Sesbania bispinosa]|nr:potassium transporter [Sesbania bispinosa]
MFTSKGKVSSAKPSTPPRFKNLGKKRSRIELPSASGKEVVAILPQLTTKATPKDGNRRYLVLLQRLVQQHQSYSHRLRFKDDENLQKSLDDNLGVHLKLQSMVEGEGASDSAPDADMEDESGSDSDMSEQPASLSLPKSGFSQPG